MFNFIVNSTKPGQKDPNEYTFDLFRIEIGQLKFERETFHLQAHHHRINIFYFLFFVGTTSTFYTYISHGMNYFMAFSHELIIEYLLPMVMILTDRTVQEVTSIFCNWSRPKKKSPNSKSSFYWFDPGTLCFYETSFESFKLIKHSAKYGLLPKKTTEKRKKRLMWPDMTI